MGSSPTFGRHLGPLMICKAGVMWRVPGVPGDQGILWYPMGSPGGGGGRLIGLLKKKAHMPMHM